MGYGSEQGEPISSGAGLGGGRVHPLGLVTPGHLLGVSLCLPNSQGAEDMVSTSQYFPGVTGKTGCAPPSPEGRHSPVWREKTSKLQQ
jgi:hypothetical protein